jgi:hypothetical protein
MCDVTMLQFLPWRRSVFYTESNGYPNFHVMKFVLGFKVVQVLVSVVIQMLYLGSTSSVHLHDPTTSSQAQALFSLNIVSSLSSVAIEVVYHLVIEDNALGTIQREYDTIDRKVQQASKAKEEEVVVHMHDLYGRTQNESTTTAPGQEPTHDVAAIEALTAQKLSLERSLAGILLEIESLRSEGMIMDDESEEG